MKINMRKTRLLLFVVLLTAHVLTGCGEDDTWHASCEAVGMCDAPVQPAETVDLLCDGSVGSSCDASTLSSVIELLLDRVVRRPGSKLRLWILGGSVAETRVVFERMSPSIRLRGDRPLPASARTWVRSTLEAALLAARPAIEGRKLRASPLIESFAKIALAGSHGQPRLVTAITDGREFADWNFECGPLPKDRGWKRWLERRDLLSPDTFADARIFFAHARLGPTGPRCEQRVDRELRIRQLWRLAFEGAGASEFSVESGVPEINDVRKGKE